MTKKEYKLIKDIDFMMNRGVFRPTLSMRLKHILIPDYVMEYINSIRKCEYYGCKAGIWNRFLNTMSKIRVRRLGLKLGFSIPENVFGPGLVLPHNGTIVVGSGNRIGKYAVLHTSTCITEGHKVIGDALYLATGAKIINDIKLGDNVSVGANAVVNENFETGNCLLVGIPASKVKESKPWYERDGMEYLRRVEACNRLLMTIN